MKKVIAIGFGIVAMLTVQGAQASWSGATYWDALEDRGAIYLDAYADLFEERPDDALEILAAFNEVAYRVTGPGGLWRSEVPGTFFGCPVNDHLQVCRRFAEVETLFAEWDEVQRQIEGIDSESDARHYLRANGNMLLDYLKYYVPGSVNLSGVTGTRFFQDRIAATLR